MNRRTQSRLEMGARALEFSRAHPDDSPGYATALKELEEQLARSNQLAEEQQAGTVEVRAASARKRALQRLIRRSQLVHLARVATRATKEVGYLPFKNVAHAMLLEAQQQKELLVRHGLVERVLEGLRQSLDEFDQVVGRAQKGGGSTSAPRPISMWSPTKWCRSCG